MTPSEDLRRTRVAGLLGTVIEVTSGERSVGASERAHATVRSEIERLEGVFSSFDERSALRRWCAGSISAPAELAHVVGLAEEWRQRSAGAFDPAAAALTNLWSGAAADDRCPTAAEIDDVLQAVTTMARPTAPTWVPPAGAYSLNALAKGWIVDRALEAAWDPAGLTRLTVNAGGDLLHRGVTPIGVGIEDPARAIDNAPPLLAVHLDNAALATSGGARRGWSIGGRWFSHVLDPRSGRPVDHHRSVSVIAPDAATADVAATIAGVLPTDEALAFIDTTEGLECCLVTDRGTIRRSPGWAALELRRGW